MKVVRTYRTRSFPPCASAGFTLIELLVVIAIIGILASVILASLNSARSKADVANAEAEMRNIRVAMEYLYDDTGKYPHGGDAVCPPLPGTNNEVSLTPSSSGLTGDPGWTGWKGPYIKSATDPWGTPYFLDQDYQCTAGAEGCGGVADPGTEDTSAIISCGPDRDLSGPGGACAYNDDNIVYVLCRN